MKNLLHYYQEEILFLRESGSKFARKYPEVAEHLDLSNSKSTDPQTERIVESFAFMAAHLHSKIDHGEENIAQHLLTGLYPGLTNVFPPCSIVNFSQNENTSSQEIININRWTRLQATNSVGQDYVFKTIYPIKIYPIKINNILINSLSQLEISISTLSIHIEQMEIRDILFHFNTTFMEEAIALYSDIFSNTQNNIYLKINEKLYLFPRDYIQSCGFNEDETMVPIPKFMNYSFQMIREVLLFPHKFLFFRVLNLDKFIIQHNISNISEFTLIFNLSNSDITVYSNSILINSTPIVNLFEYTTDPLRFDGTKNKYLLTPNTNNTNIQNNLEIHSITSVYMVDQVTKGILEIPCYFNTNFNSLNNDIQNLYWVQTNAYNHNTYISFVDTKMNPKAIYSNIVYAKTLCINRFNSRDISTNIKLSVLNNESMEITAKLLMFPTIAIYMDNTHSSLWNLINQLSFTRISKANINNILQKLKQVIHLYSIHYKEISHKLTEDIQKIEIKEENKRDIIASKHCYIKITKILVYYKQSNHNAYNFLLLKAIEKYLINNKQINTKLLIDLIKV